MEISEVMKKLGKISNSKIEENNTNTHNKDDIQNIMKMFDSINKNNANKNVNKDKKGTLLKLDNNMDTMKMLLPLMDVGNTENVHTLMSFIEVNSLIKEYKNAYKNVEVERKEDLKKEAMVHIKSSLSEENRPFIDMVIKTMELRDIMNSGFLHKNKNK